MYSDFFLLSHLIFAFQHQDIGDFPKGQAQGNDFCLRNLIWEFTNVNDSGGRVVHAVLHSQFFAVASISCEIHHKMRSSSSRLC